MDKVRIFKPSKSAMQSGRGKTKTWVLEYLTPKERYIDPLMGWLGSTQTRTQLRLTFETLDDALAYANEQGLQATVLPEHKSIIKPKSYSDNFSAKRVS